MLGLPGGQASPLFPVIKQAALESQGGMKLYAGRGNEPDTIGDKAVLVQQTIRDDVTIAPMPQLVRSRGDCAD